MRTDAILTTLADMLHNLNVLESGDEAKEERESLELAEEIDLSGDPGETIRTLADAIREQLVGIQAEAADMEPDWERVYPDMQQWLAANAG
jgi:hypothetical protein